MSLSDYFVIGLQIFSNFILLWAIIFIVVCLIVAIFYSLVMLALSRV
jgi:hypothetical protein